MIARRFEIIGTLERLPWFFWTAAMFILVFFGLRDFGIIAIIVAFFITQPIQIMLGRTMRKTAELEQHQWYWLGLMPVAKIENFLKDFCNQVDTESIKSGEKHRLDYFWGVDDNLDTYFCGVATLTKKRTLKNYLAPLKTTTIFVDKFETGVIAGTDEVDCVRHSYSADSFTHKLRYERSIEAFHQDDLLGALVEDIESAFDAVPVHGTEFSNQQDISYQTVADFYQILANVPYITVHTPNQD